MTSFQITPQTPTMAAHVHIGVSRQTEVVWNVYPKAGETQEALAKRVEDAHQGLARWDAKFDCAVITVNRLSHTALSYIEDHAGCAGESGEMVSDYAAMTMTKSSVTATRRLLEAVRDRLADQVEDYADMAFQSEFSDNENRAVFREKAARRSVNVCVQRLTLGIEGKRQPRKIPNA